MVALNDRHAPTLTVYQRVPADRPDLPDWCFYFLVDEARRDVYAPAVFLGFGEQLLHALRGTLVVYPFDGDVPAIRGRPFVSAQAVGESDPRFEAFRRDLLHSFDNCRETFDVSELEGEL